MFSIAAINDTDSRGQWEPLAPTKEAQEFHLTQAYHDGLLKLQAKDYEKARELLESVLKDPLISNAQVDNNTTDGHLLQLKFLALKNLATVFLQQGSSHYESALRCYLQAVEIDNKDSVVWNQLGTLSCSMGSLSISRWAFEQGLSCSPNNWNCMEKLLEVLIAIGDEVACLSVAELILRHWPSHSRALHVKNTIEESESVPFAPRGIDKLEPQHVRLKFQDKRKAPDENLDEGTALKKLNQNLELQIAEASWAALADGLLGILRPLNGCGSEVEPGKLHRSGDVRLSILSPPSAEIVMEPVEKKVPILTSSGERMSPGDCDSERASNLKEKESNFLEEQPQERRSSRLERLRSRKPGKEELDFTAGKDLAKIVLQLLESFVISKREGKDLDDIVNCSVSCADQANTLDMECRDVANFVRETSKNYGAYHMGHLLLERAASRSIVHPDAHVKFLELEKLLRNWGQERTPECSLFLAELYHDIGSSPSNSSNLSEFLSEASYHLCKIIESVALDHPFHLTFGIENCSLFKSFQGTDAISPDSSNCESSHLDSFLLSNKSAFWARYFWLSGQLSVLDGNKAKAYEEFCISMSLLAKKENANNSLCTVQLPHCKISKELTVERIFHEINLLKVDFLLEKTLGEMIEKEMYLECVNSLAPLLFSTNSLSPLLAADPKGDGITPVELLALDILIKACQKIKPIDIELYLNSHMRKLQILMALAGMSECVAFGKPFHQKSGSKMLSGPEMVSSDSSRKHWNQLVSEEVKAILQCVSQVKNFIDQSGDSSVTGFVSIFSDIQSLLLAIMYNIANNVLCKKSSMPVAVDQLEQKQSNCFIDAAIAFCKLQHLDPSVTVKTQVELIVAIHDLLAEYGLCCAGEGREGEEATFLKFAIKHLLALDMKLKSSFNSSIRETSPDDRQPSNDNDFKTSENEMISDKLDVKMCGTQISESITATKDDIEGITSKGTPSFSGQEKDNATALRKQCSNVDESSHGEKCAHQLDECANELTEDEREELELMIDNALDQCFFCLYGLNLRSDSSYDDELAVHRNTSRGDYQTKEQCADVFQYILPSAKASSRTGLVKLRRVLRTIRKHFHQPPEEILAGNIIDKFFDDPDLCEDKLSEMAGSEGYLETITKMLLPNGLKQYKASLLRSSEPYLEVYSNLYYFLAQSEEMNATDKWPGFVLTKEGEEFVQQNANLFKYDLLYNPLRFESWQRLANIYDEEVDLLLNDGSKHINVSGWRKSTTLPQRVETSRRRSRRCLLMSLALAKTPEQQCEIHELLALVYYDSLQNVVPFFDQRSVVPSRDAAWRMYCENSLRHFKKAFMHKQDWSHAFYIGKLCQKLGYSHETSLSYYDKAIALNPSAVDPFYRMHASRLKLLWTCGKQNLEVLKVLSTYSFSQFLKDDVMGIIRGITPETSLLEEDIMDKSCKKNMEEKHHDKSEKMEEVWNMLYNDCLSALEICVGGDLKHFHKARFMLAQGLYKKGGKGDLQKAKDELSFCFKSSRSSFTINMWEIDGMVKKGKRKTPGLAGNKKALEVNLPESSRKFITCIRKYLLFYLKLLEETGDVCTLDRAYVSLRSDKRFSLCIEDLVPVALGRHIKAVVLSMSQVETAAADPACSFEHQLEKIFSLFMEQGTLWPEICSLPEIKSPEISESSLYGYLHRHIVSLERNGKLEILEAINERIRKRFKNPKLSNSNCAKVCRHASIAWYRSIIIGLASITPLQSGFPSEVQTLNQPIDGAIESSQQLCIDLQTHEIWNSPFEDSTHLESLKTKWSPTLAKINNILIKKASDGDLETANSLLRSSYNFYRESSCVMLPSGINLSSVPFQLVKEKQFPSSMEGVEPLDLSIPRKLLLWAYTLLTGRYASISVVVKHCEENAKLKMKRGAATSSTPLNMNISSAVSSHTAVGIGKEAASHGGGSEAEAALATSGPPVLLSESDSRRSTSPLPSASEGQRSLLMAPQLHPCNNIEGERSTFANDGDDPNKA